MEKIINKIKMPIEMELKEVFENINSIMLDNFTNLDLSLRDFIFSSSKKLRPILILLFAKALNGEITKKDIQIATAIELLHNATLIHDDVIDAATKRRGMTSLNIKYSNSLAVVAGDYLFSVALKPIFELKSDEINKIFIEAMFKICKGEISQNLNKFNIPTMEEYLEKCNLKTAKLFETGLLCISEIAKKNYLNEKIKNFTRNFGIAFQIKDDIKNIQDINSDKNTHNDITDGIYTLPVIFANKTKNLADKNIDDIIEASINPKSIEKSKNELEKYVKNAILALDFIEDNESKFAIIELCNQIKEDYV